MMLKKVDKMEMGQKNKVAKLNENQNPMGKEEEVEVDDVDNGDDIELSDMDNLPTEILVKILDYLDEQELVKCRLLSSRWNEICCLLLPDKTKNKHYSKLIVQVKKNMECTTVITKSLADFLACFAPSEAEKSSDSARPFPFSHFTFKSLKYLDLDQIEEFVSTFGPQMKSVFVEINSEGVQNIEKLRGILHLAPNIQRLRIIDDDFSLRNAISFDPVSKSDPNCAFLKNLKVLEIASDQFGKFNGFMKDLLDNAPKVERVLSFKAHIFWDIAVDLAGLQVWKQLGKAHLLKSLEISVVCSNSIPPVVLMKNLRLQSLDANCWLHSNYVEKDNSISNYIYHALKSNRETLSSLNLWNLNAESMNHCFKDIASLPNVRHLEITTKYNTETPNVLQRLSQICQNITSMNLGMLPLDEFSKVAPILQTRFQGLKSLKFGLDMEDALDDSLDLDSVLSGYSKESIQKIQSKLDGGISLEEAARGESQNSPILNLKDLSCLELEFDMGKRTDEMEKVENQLRNSFFVKLLPRHIRENPRSLRYSYY